MLPRPPTSTLFPYTTLFRSDLTPLEGQLAARVAAHPEDAAALIDLSDRKSTRLNSSHVRISYAVFCLKKKIFHPSADYLRHFPFPLPTVAVTRVEPPAESQL